jgi:hypothetical protein
LFFCFLGEGIAENAGSGQDNELEGNLNISNEGTELSNKHTMKKKKQDAKKNKNSDSEAKETNHSALALKRECPDRQTSIASTRNKAKNAILDSDSEIEEMCLSSLVRKEYVPDAERSMTEGSLNGSTKNKLRSATFDSDSEIEEMRLGSLVWRDDSPDTNRIASGGNSNGTMRNKLRSIVLYSDSENEDTKAEAQKTTYKPKRAFSGLDSDGDTSYSNKKSTAVSSLDEFNTVYTKKRHLDEETNGSIDVRKRCRVIMSDDEDN